MEIKEFIEKFADAVDVDTVEALAPETNFHTLDEWSSIALLSVIALADEEFNVEVSGKEVENVNTIQELYDLISNKK